MYKYFQVLIVVGAQLHATEVTAREPNEKAQPASAWRVVPNSPGSGLLSERLKLWRSGRLWYMLEAEDSYLISGFESRPGRHPWQGEHVGKWLHAATLAYEQTHDEKLLKALQEMVQRLLAAQDANGYLGTYGADYTFMAQPENSGATAIADDVAGRKKTAEPRAPKPKGGWDTWTLRYNIYGLLTYDKFHPNPRVVEACRKMADLLIDVYGENKADLTKYGTRQGISATTLLESVVMLYERTRDKKYLDFAEHIVALSEKNPRLRLMGNMLENGSVVASGDGKAYQLMANLLGYLGLYRNTGNERYLQTMQNAWHDINARHRDVTGGPWSRFTPYNGNRECFAYPRDYDPAEADVETCSTTTWIQLNLHLLELTGQARYAVEAERALFNSLIASQNGEGLDWCYYTRANQNQRPYETAIKCCSSSGPRALEMFARYLIGEVPGGISFTSLAPCSAVLPDSLGGAEIQITGNYPQRPDLAIRIKKAGGKEFALEFHDPADSRLKSARVNGQEIALSMNDRGYYQLSRVWKTGDEIAIEFEYLLKSHLVTQPDDPRWIAFTYGPWALAQTTRKGVALAEPFIGKKVQATSASQWLEALPPDKNGAPRFRIKDTEIQLGPFYSAGSKESGPRTYFRITPPAKS